MCHHGIDGEDEIQAHDRCRERWNIWNRNVLRGDDTRHYSSRTLLKRIELNTGYGMELPQHRWRHAAPAVPASSLPDQSDRNRPTSSGWHVSTAKRLAGMKVRHPAGDDLGCDAQRMGEFHD